MKSDRQIRKERNQAELARGYKDNYRRRRLIDKAKQATGWDRAEFARRWFAAGRPRSEYWDWVAELTADC